MKRDDEAAEIAGIPSLEDCGRFYTNARSEAERLRREIEKLRTMLAGAEQEASAWDAIAVRHHGTSLEPPPDGRTVHAHDSTHLTVLDLMIHCMWEEPKRIFRPLDVSRAIAEKFKRQLSESAVTTTRDRHPAMFEKVPGARGAFRLNPELKYSHPALATQIGRREDK